MILVINLARRTDRWQRISRELDTMGADYVRVDAVDSHCLVSEDLSYTTAEVAACWLSHQRAYAAAAESRQAFSLILEDDAQVTAQALDVYSRLQAADRGLNRRFDVLQLGFLMNNAIEHASVAVTNVRASTWKAVAGLLPQDFQGGPLRWKDRARVKQAQRQRVYESQLGVSLVWNQFLAGAHCYIVARSAAAQLLSVNRPVWLSADLALMSLSRMRSLRMARCARSLSRQVPSLSDIPQRFKTLDATWLLSE